jgi:large subunit ribosomal protein L13
MKLTQATKGREIKREWHHVDVKGAILGRIATEIALYLMGKSKPYYISNLDCGDYVVVTNATHVKVTGKKASQKIYDAYSGYPGGRKEQTFATVRANHPERIIQEAVAGMLPKNKLRDSMLKRLYVYPDESHPYKDKINK